MKKLFLLSFFLFASLLGFVNAQNFTSTFRFGESGFELFTHITQDDEGGIYALGIFEKKINLGPFSLNPTSGMNAFIVKVDSNGDFSWSRQFSGYYLNFSDVIIDGQGNVVVGGSFDESLDIVDPNQNNEISSNFCHYRGIHLTNESIDLEVSISYELHYL